ncbi:MAG: glycogen synthase GlgA [Candidatus Omnitrophica bacterium]|nr:glycogen synthase GlgA [Candidatus Omnitrophota bacterium]
MNILFCSSEVVPFAKTGGLADVAGALPIALEHEGHQVRVALPKYKMVKEESDSAVIGEAIKVHLIRNDELYMRDGIYGDEKGDYPDNLERFMFYCRQTLELMKSEGFRPDIIHCNDWQTGLIPVYLKTVYKDDPFFKDTRTLFTIHNLAYTGSFEESEFDKTGLDRALFSIDGLEYYGKFSLLKGGLVFSDAITAVSPTYAKEIQTKEYGCGMEGILKARSADLYGVLNGIDYELWDPAKDALIYEKYSPSSIEGKCTNKERLLADMGMKTAAGAPLIGTVGRLAYQKGYDILAEVMDELCGMDIGFILLGTGEERYHKIFEEIASRGNSKISINLCFDAALAQKIYAASDMFLMPSRYEPCGLGQLISFKYGAVPVARKTGGLADTVFEYDAKTGDGNGFLFEKAEPQELLGAIKRAVEAHKDGPGWQRLITKIAGYDFSWDKSAQEYTRIYEKLKAKK